MATAKKSAAKKPRKIAKKAPVVAVAANANKIIDSTKNVVAPEGVVAKKRGPGRPAGKKSSKKGAGRPAATKFLYSLSRKPASDDLGLEDAPTPEKIEVIGPFASEEAAMADALGVIGTQNDVTVTLYRDYRTGSVEVRTRLV